METETAIQFTMDECIRNDILAEILRKEKVVVMNSILTELDEQAYAEGLREDGFEDGFENGLQQGIRKGIQTFIETCMEVNFTRQETLDRIITKMQLPLEDAEGYMTEYWK